ncbi:MAG: hypothetical protein BGO27_03895 [Alphaproteobacteria bacterium 33-17]|nr:MAG: hypothetical protein BGO27_03895 [Alphaproteobacteria bacterium 33-17]
MSTHKDYRITSKNDGITLILKPKAKRNNNAVANSSQDSELVKRLKEKISTDNVRNEFDKRFNKKVSSKDYKNFPAEFTLDDLVVYKDKPRAVSFRQVIEVIDTCTREIETLELENKNKLKAIKSNDLKENWLKNNDLIFSDMVILLRFMIDQILKDNKKAPEFEMLQETIVKRASELKAYEEMKTTWFSLNSSSEVFNQDFSIKIRDNIPVYLELEKMLLQKNYIAKNLNEFGERLSIPVSAKKMNKKKHIKPGSILKIEDEYREISMEQIVDISIILYNKLGFQKKNKTLYKNLEFKFSNLIELELSLFADFKEMLSRLSNIEAEETLKKSIDTIYKNVIASELTYEKILLTNKLVSETSQMADDPDVIKERIHRLRAQIENQSNEINTLKNHLKDEIKLSSNLKAKKSLDSEAQSNNNQLSNQLNKGTDMSKKRLNRDKDGKVIINDEQEKAIRKEISPFLTFPFIISKQSLQVLADQAGTLKRVIKWKEDPEMFAAMINTPVTQDLVLQYNTASSNDLVAVNGVPVTMVVEQLKSAAIDFFDLFKSSAIHINELDHIIGYYRHIFKEIFKNYYQLIGILDGYNKTERDENKRIIVEKILNSYLGLENHINMIGGFIDGKIKFKDSYGTLGSEEYIKLKDKYKAAKGKIKALEIKILDLNLQKEEAEKELFSLKKQVESLSKQNKANEEATKKNQILSLTIDSIKKQLEAKETELGYALSERRNAQSELSKFKDFVIKFIKIHNSEAKIPVSEKDLMKIAEEILIKSQLSKPSSLPIPAPAKGKIGQQQDNRIKELEDENAIIKDQNKILSSENMTLEVRNNNLQTTNSKQKDALINLRMEFSSKFDSQQTQIDSQQAEIEKLREMLKTANATIEAQKLENNELKQKNSSSEQETNDSIANTQNNQQTQINTEEFDRLEAEIASLKEDKQKIKFELNKIKFNQSISTGNLEVEKLHNSNLKICIENLQKQLKESKDKIRNLKNELEAEKEKTEYLTNTFKAQISKIQEMYNQVDQRNREAEEIKSADYRSQNTTKKNVTFADMVKTGNIELVNQK